MGQSFITLPSSNVADSSHSSQSQPNRVSLRLEKRGQAYINLPDVGLLQLVVSPSPQIFLTPRSQVGSLEGGQRWPAEGDARGEDPTRLEGGEWHLSPPFVRQSLLEVSEIFQGNARNIFKSQLPGVHLSPEAGETVKLRTSMFQIQANTLLQQSEANLAWGFQEQEEECHGRMGPGVKKQQAEQGHDSGSSARTQDVGSSRRNSRGVLGTALRRAAPDSLAEWQEALYMQLSPEEDSSQSSPGTSREGGNSLS